MTLLFIDGFDSFNSYGQIVDKWNYSNITYHPNTTYGRFGSKGLTITSAGNLLGKILGSTYTTFYVGFAFKYYGGVAPTVNTTYPFFEFRDEEDTSQVKLFIDSAYAINGYRGDNTYLGKSSDYVVIDNKWHFLEVKATINDTTGELVVRIDESTVLNLTSQDTKNGTAYIDRFYIRGIAMEWDIYLDDVYVDDSQFHGDCRVRTFMPDSDGNSSDFTRSGGSNDYECVDEDGSNEDTDYIYSDTLNHKSIFGITTGSLGTVEGIQVNNHVRLDQAGTRKIKAICRSNSTDYQGSESDNIPADYIYESEIWETDPDDSNPWTQTKLEAAEFGLEITT